MILTVRWREVVPMGEDRHPRMLDASFDHAGAIPRVGDRLRVPTTADKSGVVFLDVTRVMHVLPGASIVLTCKSVENTTQE